jgi:threonine dehydrogenase-like Zn-dependent dehydrogenase
MKALLKPDGGAGLELADVPVARPGVGEILVKVFAGGSEVRVDLANGVIFKGARVARIFGRKVWQTGEQGTAFLRRGLDVTLVITHRLSLERFEEAFALLKSGEAGKVILYV